jgi:Flp pilus assembly protein TadG
MSTRALRKRLRQFRADQRGNIAILFALAMIPVFGLIGLAIDYSRAADVRTAMQAAVDATALLLSKEASGLTKPQLESKATAYFNANFNRPEAKGVMVKPTLTTPSTGNWSLKVDVTGAVDTYVMRWVNNQSKGLQAPNQLNLAASSQVNWGNKKLEIMLALDNTGSMSSSNKMTELKKAAKTLVQTLQKASKNNGDVKVGIVPFDTTVNMGTALKFLPIFDVSCSALGNPSGCTSSNAMSYWEGCVRDRTWPYDAQVTMPTFANSATLFPIYDCGSLTSLQILTTNWGTLNTKIDAMTPNGMTNVTMGIAWAWLLLQNNVFTGAAAPAADLDKVILLLTDGENTEAWKNSNNTKITEVTTIDSRTKLACDNAKAAGIRIYTVRVIEGNADLLRDCASNSGMYYDVQNAADLNGVFTAIANSLAKLYIAK